MSDYDSLTGLLSAGGNEEELAETLLSTITGDDEIDSLLLSAANCINDYAQSIRDEFPPYDF